MKKIATCICVITMVISGIVIPTKIQASSVNMFEVSAESNLDNIMLRWEKQEGVSYYNIYRVIQRSPHMYEKKKDYKCVVTLASDNTEYVDKNVKRGIRYCYFIRGYKENGEKDKIVCTSYVDWNPLIAIPGLDTPVIRGAGYSKERNRFKLFIEYETAEQVGMEPTGYDVYRKQVGKKQYKKIKVKKLGQNKVADEKAIRGRIYKYKVKAYIIVDGKKYYSKRSNIFTLDTTNYIGRYNVKLLNDKGKDTSTLTFKVKSKNKYNGNTFFYGGGATYFYRNSAKEKTGRYDVKFTKYSLDNKKWKKIPKKGVVLKARKNIYLKCDVYKSESNERATIYLGKGKPKQSYIFFGESKFGDAIEYRDSKYYTEAKFNFITKKGRAHQEGD